MERGPWAFIWRVRFSVMHGAACIRRSIWSSPASRAFDKLWQAARGHVRMLTIAPELNGAEEVIAEASKRGVCVSIGHSDADSRTGAPRG